MERMSWGIQQRLNETTIHPGANIGGHMWTSDLRLRVRHFSTEMSTSLLEVLRGIPPRVAMQDGEEEAMISEESFPAKRGKSLGSGSDGSADKGQKETRR